MDKYQYNDKQVTTMIEHSWKRVLAIAQNQPEDISMNGSNIPTTQNNYNNHNNHNNHNNNTRLQHRILSPLQIQHEQNQLYDRERSMIQALDTLFSLSCEGSGYVTFLATMVSVLDYDCPVSMAFLSHVIDRASLPSKDTLSCISPAILSKLNIRPIHINNNLDKNIVNSKWKSWMIQPSITSSSSPSTKKYSRNMGKKPVTEKMKRNAAVIWATLAEKFAGELAHLLWNLDVANLLISFVANHHEDLNVRIFSLLALEKFALTGDIKTSILQNPLNIRSVLESVIHENSFNLYNQDDHNNIHETSFLYNDNNNENSNNRNKNKTNNNNKISARFFSMFYSCKISRRQQPTINWISGCVRRLSRRKINKPYNCQSKYNYSFSGGNMSNDFKLQSHGSITRRSQNSQNIIRKDPIELEYNGDDNLSFLGYGEADKNGDDIKIRHSSDHNWMNNDNNNINNSSSFSFHDPHNNNELDMNINSVDNSHMKQLQLAHCVQWSLDNIFVNSYKEKNDNLWDLTNLNVVLNPFDATKHWKIGGNGLEIRNDRPHFESIRATECVKQGRWYYEVLLVTAGIMQIGWCTKRCKFVPEEGYGVGDDQHGFAFDTYRSAVWANGSVIYSQYNKEKIQCKPGDVLGSYLDLDNGICSFFINGRDLGLTVAFEHSSSKATSNEMEGLYPAFSLTTHQHVILNFGDQPWIYEPDLSNIINSSSPQTIVHKNQWNGFNNACIMSNELRNQINHWQIHHRHSKYFNMNASNHIENKTSNETLSSNVNDPIEEDDWDGPLCTMCFNEPKNTKVLPCGHGIWGSTCTKMLEYCPLCRIKIEGYSNCI
ncbi:unnamed protein product [Cunninghamella blakesleeana]